MEAEVMATRGTKVAEGKVSGGGSFHGFEFLCDRSFRAGGEFHGGTANRAVRVCECEIIRVARKYLMRQNATQRNGFSSLSGADTENGTFPK
jgi:hypothetical protein